MLFGNINYISPLQYRGYITKYILGIIRKNSNYNLRKVKYNYYTESIIVSENVGAIPVKGLNYYVKKYISFRSQNLFLINLVVES